MSRGAYEERYAIPETPAGDFEENFTHQIEDVGARTRTYCGRSLERVVWASVDYSLTTCPACKRARLDRASGSTDDGA